MGDIAQPHVREWSTVFRARTRRGAIYLKCCGPSQAHEPRLTELLARIAGNRVPTLIARHPRRDWMLLADGGTKLREAFRGRDLLREWERSLVLNAEIQLALVGRERELLATRTPDHRLERLPSLVAAVLGDKSVLHRASADPLSTGERRSIAAALPMVEERCRELAGLGIGPSIDHDDLHDGNVLRRGRRTVIFDWGDACVTHPFLCLTIALRTVARHAGVRPADPRVARLRDAYLEPFGRFGSITSLGRAADLGERLGMITRALSWYRVVTLTGARDEGEESLASWLRLVPRAFPVRSSRAR